MYSIPHRPPPTVQNPDESSADFLQFLVRCLTKEPDLRPGARELLKDSFLIEFLLRAERDIFREPIEQALQMRREVTSATFQSPSKGQSLMGSSNFTTTRTATRRLATEEGTSVFDENAPSGTAVIRSKMEDFPMGTSVIRDEDEDDVVEENEGGQFRVMFQRPPASPTNKMNSMSPTNSTNEKINQEPKFRTIGTQTDPVEIRPIKEKPPAKLTKLSTLQRQQSFKKKELHKPSLPTPSNPVAVRNNRRHSVAFPAKGGLPSNEARSPPGRVRPRLLSPSLEKTSRTTRPTRVLSPTERTRVLSPTERTKSSKPPTKANQPQATKVKTNPPLPPRSTRPKATSPAPVPEGRISVGQTVVLNNGKRGTVKYVGKIRELENDDTWIGLELLKPGKSFEEMQLTNRREKQWIRQRNSLLQM